MPISARSSMNCISRPAAEPARPRVRVRRVLAGFALLVGPLVANAQSLPTLTAEAGQERTRAHGVLSPIPLWDTSWWIVVQGTPKGAPLRPLDYPKRFPDSI